MQLGYSEKRDYYRMSVSCPIEFEETGGKGVERGSVVNLSGSGILFRSNRELIPGTRLKVALQPISAGTKPLCAYATVSRCEYWFDQQCFGVACLLDNIH